MPDEDQVLSKVLWSVTDCRTWQSGVECRHGDML